MVEIVSDGEEEEVVFAVVEDTVDPMVLLGTLFSSSTEVSNPPSPLFYQCRVTGQNISASDSEETC